MLYPYGNLKRGVNDHISLYLAMEEAKEIYPGSQVDVILKFFVYDHIRDKFLTIQCTSIAFHLTYMGNIYCSND